MANQNHVVFTGRLVRTPERLNSQTPGVKFTLVQNDRIRNDQTGQWEDGEAHFVEFVAWGNVAENVMNLGHDQGDLLNVCGRLTYRKFTDSAGNNRSTLEVKANEVGLVMKRGAGTNSSGQQRNPQPAQQAPVQQGFPPQQPAQQGWGGPQPGAAQPAQPGETPF